MLATESIWFETPDHDEIKKFNHNTADTHMGIEIVEFGNDYLKATMPVDQRTRQPYGLLHGGASVLLAESVASLAAIYAVDGSKFYCVGQEINANHIRGVREGLVTAIAKPLHLGRNSHVWEVKIYNEAEKLVCVVRMTAAVLEIKNQNK